MLYETTIFFDPPNETYLLKLGPLIFREDNFSVGEVKSPNNTELAIHLLLFWQTSQGLLDNFSLAQSIVMSQTCKAKIYKCELYYWDI